MKKYCTNIILGCFFCGSCGFGFAQVPSIQWQKCLGGTSGDEAHSIFQNSDSGYIFTGTSTSNNGNVSGNHGSYDIWVARLNKFGNIIWQNCYGGTNADYGRSVRQTNDGGFIFAGYTTSNNGNVSSNHGGNDFWVVKLNSTGTIQWQKTLGGTASEIVSEIKQTADHGFIIGGSTTSNNGDVTGNHGSSDFWIVKLDSLGTIQWQKSLGGSSSDALASICQTSDGGYIASGNSMSSDGNVTVNYGSNDCWIVKLDNLGNLQWQKSYGGSASESAESIEQTSNGGYIFSGYTLSNNGNVNGNNGTNDFWLVKLDANGNIQKQKSLGGTDNDFAYSVHQTIDDGFVTVGKIDSYNGFVTLNHGPWDIWVVKTDNNCTVQWQRSYGGSSLEVAYSIIQTMDGGLLVAGLTWSNDGDVNGQHGSQDVWLIKLSNINILPVELASFTAGVSDNKQIICEWTTMSENNNAYFSIERSSDDSHFIQIGILDGAGFSNSKIEYNFIDLHPSNGISYYRLKQTDFDGNNSYSKPVSVQILDSPQVIVYQNFSNGIFTITLNKSLNNSMVHVYDLTGKKILTQKLNDIETLINLTEFTSGFYFIKIVNTNGTKIFKVVN